MCDCDSDMCQDAVCLTVTLTSLTLSWVMSILTVLSSPQIHSYCHQSLSLVTVISHCHLIHCHKESVMIDGAVQPVTAGHVDVDGGGGGDSDGGGGAVMYAVEPWRWWRQ